MVTGTQPLFAELVSLRDFGRNIAGTEPPPSYLAGVMMERHYAMVTSN